MLVMAYLGGVDVIETFVFVNILIYLLKQTRLCLRLLFLYAALSVGVVHNRQ